MNRLKQKTIEIIDLWGKGLTNLEIAENLALTKTEILRTLGKHGKKSNKHKILDESSIKQLLIGSYLGDGHFSKIDKGESRLTITHSFRQKEYFLQKFNKLKNLGLVETYKEFEHKAKSNRTFIYLTLQTKAHPVFSKFRELGYDNKEIFINTELIKDMNAEGFSIWFFDDASVTKYGVAINCSSIPEHEKEIIKDIIYKNLDLELNITPDTLYVRSNQMEKLVNIVNPFCLESMKYKLIPYKFR